MTKTTCWPEISLVVVAIPLCWPLISNNVYNDDDDVDVSGYLSFLRDDFMITHHLLLSRILPSQSGESTRWK